MNKKPLTETQIENLIELVDELQQKIKRKHENLTLTRYKLGNAKRSIKRLQEVIAYQRLRILELHHCEGINVNNEL